MAPASNEPAPAPAPGPSRPTPLYELSSQYRHWRFSQAGLDKARQEINEGAVERVRSKLEEEERETAATDPDAPPPGSRQYLSPADELALVGFYLTRISALCRASFFRFPENVEATAVTYLKRFYIRNTCMDYHPKNVMLTCLFLATKTENVAISIDHFASRIPNCTPDDVLSLEFRVAQSLRFEFKVHHAHTAARGVLIELQAETFGNRAGELSEEEKQAWRTKWDKVRTVVAASRLTDAEFLYTPSQIAVAAWSVADDEATRSWVARKGEKAREHREEWEDKQAKFAADKEKENNRNEDTSRRAMKNGRPSPVPPSSNGAAQPDDLDASSLFSLISPLVTLLSSPLPPTNKDLVTGIDRRLKLVRNPEKDPSSALYRKRQREEEARERDKRREKQSLQDPPDDPFGPPVQVPMQVDPFT